MRLLSLLLVAAALPACRCSKDEPRPVDAAPTTSATVSAAPEAAAPEEIEWIDCTSSPSKMDRLHGRWGDKKPWAQYDKVNKWEEDHPDAGAWPYPYTSYLVVHSDEPFECGFFTDKMEVSYCIFHGDKTRRVTTLKVEMGKSKSSTRMKITAGDNAPVVVVRNATP